MTTEQTIAHINAIAAINKQAPLLEYSMREVASEHTDATRIECTITQIGGLQYVIWDTLPVNVTAEDKEILKADLAARTLADLFYELLNS